jgi:hypothetical protein
MSERRHQLLHSAASAVSQASQRFAVQDYGNNSLQTNFTRCVSSETYRIVPEQFMADLDRALSAYDGKAFEDQLPESMRGSA